MSQAVTTNRVEVSRRRLGHYVDTHGIQRSEISRIEVPLHISSKNKHVLSEIRLFGRTHHILVSFEEGTKGMFGMGDYVVVLTADGTSDEINQLEVYLKTLFGDL